MKTSFKEKEAGDYRSAIRRLLLGFSKLDLDEQSSFIDELNKYLLVSKSERRKLQKHWETRSR